MALAVACMLTGPLRSTTREVRKMIRMLNGLNIVGCDVVEVSPPYDSQGECGECGGEDGPVRC